MEFYSWSEAGGRITKWTFLIKRDGEISIEKSVIAEGVGSYVIMR